MDEEQTLYLEIAGMVADLLGMVDPTPISDTTSAGIAFYQGDVVGGCLSLVGIIPYLGDLAKIGKLPRYVQTLQKALKIAAKKPTFAKKIRPWIIRLKAVLGKIPTDFLPASVAASVNAMKAELRAAENLIVSPKLSAAIEGLTGDVRKIVGDALQLPLEKNPRKFPKFPGPVTEATLKKELATKQFKQVKVGTHGPGGTPKYGGVADDSDVYLRRIRDENGAELFEAIRIDKHTPNPKLDNPTLKPGHTKHYQNPRGEIRPWDNLTQAERQAGGKPHRRVHNTLADESTPADMIDHVSEGRAWKSDFSHWHRETFPATDENLVKYFKGGGDPDGILRFDPSGMPVTIPVKKK